MTIHDATEAAYKNGYEQGKKDAVGDILSATDATKWIPVTERLPEKNRCILICSKQGGIAEGVYMGGGAWIQYRWNAVGMDVTHWMPLPEAPKEDA